MTSLPTEDIGLQIKFAYILQWGIKGEKYYIIFLSTIMGVIMLVPLDVTTMGQTSCYIIQTRAVAQRSKDGETLHRGDDQGDRLVTRGRITWWLHGRHIGHARFSIQSTSLMSGQWARHDSRHRPWRTDDTVMRLFQYPRSRGDSDDAVENIVGKNAPQEEKESWGHTLYSA